MMTPAYQQNTLVEYSVCIDRMTLVFLFRTLIFCNKWDPIPVHCIHTCMSVHTHIWRGRDREKEVLGWSFPPTHHSRTLNGVGTASGCVGWRKSPRGFGYHNCENSWLAVSCPVPDICWSVRGHHPNYVVWLNIWKQYILKPPTRYCLLSVHQIL